METTKMKQVQIPRYLELASQFDGRMRHRRKIKLSPAQSFFFWAAIIIAIGTVSSYLASLIV